MHAIGSTFGGVIKFEIKGEFCRIKVNLDVQKQLRSGVFVSPSDKEKIWLPFKYENVPTFCFSCGRMGHGVKECSTIYWEDDPKADDEQPFSVALKAESSMVGKV